MSGPGRDEIAAAIGHENWCAAISPLTGQWHDRTCDCRTRLIADAVLALFDRAPDTAPAGAARCSTCGGTGLVDWLPGQQRHSEEDQQECPDCDGPEVALAGAGQEETFVDAVLATEVSWEVADLNLTVGDVVTVARWLAPVAAALAAPPAPTTTDAAEVAAALIETDAIQQDDPETLRPERYFVWTENLPYLVRTIFDLSAAASSSSVSDPAAGEA